MSTRPALGNLLHSFFEDHLVCQKGLRPTTVRSYSDAIRLFLQFAASDKGCKLTKLDLNDMTGDRVLKFLNHLEKERGNGAASRNQRLAAIRCLFDYFAARQPEMLAGAHRVAGIPIKRSPPPRTHYLERDDVEAVFEHLPENAPMALRDRTLLLFLYNTGARAQEIADLRVGNLDLDNKPRVRLHGKGDKWRVCPLWKQCAHLLGELISQYRNQPDAPVFVSRTGRPLTRFGIYKLVRRHTTASGDFDIGRSTSPHCWRHTAAVHLLESGVEPNVIRAWLGHVSLETTNRYAEINLRMKAQALEACEPPVSALMEHPRTAKWRDDAALLDWLKSL
jgi:site-specific recombinase XerD